MVSRYTDAWSRLKQEQGRLSVYTKIALVSERNGAAVLFYYIINIKSCKINTTY